MITILGKHNLKQECLNKPVLKLCLEDFVDSVDIPLTADLIIFYDEYYKFCKVLLNILQKEILISKELDNLGIFPVEDLPHVIYEATKIMNEKKFGKQNHGQLFLTFGNETEN